MANRIKKLKQIVNGQAIYSWIINCKGFIFPNKGHAGANGLYIPYPMGTDWPWSWSLLGDMIWRWNCPDNDSIYSFWGISILKDTPRKLVNILLRSSSKIPAFRKQVKTLKTKDPVCAVSLEHARAFSLQACIFASLLLSSKSPMRPATRGAAGSGS